MQANTQPRQPPRSIDSVGRGRAADHETCRRQDAAPKCLLNSLVDGEVEAEVVGADNQRLQ